MKDEQIKLHFQRIRQRVAALCDGNAKAWQDINAMLEDLHAIYEEMQTTLEAVGDLNNELLGQVSQVTERYHHNNGSSHALPIAYLMTDASGIIVAANQATSNLLKVPLPYLIGKPLFLYVAKSDRSSFYQKVNYLSHSRGTQIWQINLKLREGQLLPADLHVDVIWSQSDSVAGMQIAVHPVDRLQPTIQQPIPTGIETASSLPLPQLPQSLDGLQVLVVDDDDDTREFITTVLELHGVNVKTAANASAALEMLEQFRPDVLLSDIRMPNGDGYSLIQKLRALESKQGKHIPAAAITAYLDEERAKALTVGFEAYLHKLAEPSELIELVAQLAGRVSR